MFKKTVCAFFATGLFFCVTSAEKAVTASSFGFKAEDATECLQKAIKSGAAEVIVDNTGKDWIVSSPIQLVSNQTVTFENGVMVKAAKDAFKKPRPMFTLTDGQNVIIQGKGNARIEMNRKDYRNPKLFQQSEHRHIFSFAGVSNLTIRNLTLAESGGDGIYLGGHSKKQKYCENILIENVVFNGHNRLGMAVISGRNVTVRNCKFINAVGAPPQGGIDFEPNSASEVLENCLVENCIFENNGGPGVSVSPAQLSADSPAVSVTVCNCKFKNNAQDFYFHPYFTKTGIHHTPARGKVLVENCDFTAANMLATPVETVALEFINCKFKTPPKNGTLFIVNSEDSGNVPQGNIRFKNCILEDTRSSEQINIFNFRYAGRALLSYKMGGELFLVGKDGKKTAFDFDSLKNTEIKRFADLYKYSVKDVNKKSLAVPSADAERKGNGGLWFRGGLFLQYAEAGQEIGIKVRTRRVGYDSAVSIIALSPSGKQVAKLSMPPGEKDVLKFKAGETGIYTIDAKTFNTLDLNSPHKGNGWIMRRGQFLLIYSQGMLYFVVPAGVKEFAFAIECNSSGEFCLLDSKNKRVIPWTQANDLKVYTYTRANADSAEIFAIACRKVKWGINIRLYDPLPGVVSTNPATLFR